MSYGRRRFVTQLNSQGKGAPLRQWGFRLGSVGNASQCAAKRFVDVNPIHGVLLLHSRREVILSLGVFDLVVFLQLLGGLVVVEQDLSPRRKGLDVKDPALQDGELLVGRGVHDDGDATHSAVLELLGDGGDGVVDPGAEARVAGLVDGEVEGAGGEEGCGGVEGAVVEEGVEREGEEGCEGGEEG